MLVSCGNKTSENGEKGILDSMFKTNNTPKCDDLEVTSTVLTILQENSRNLIDEYGRHSTMIDPNKSKIINIMTTSKDDDLSICNCEGTVKTELQEGNVIYSAQKNSEGEVIVKVEDAGPFRFKFDK